MRTKIIATIGPASSSYDTLLKLAEAGVSVFRLNFSHGNREFFEGVISSIRSVEKSLKKPLSILQDLSGPKIRIGTLSKDAYDVSLGDQFLLGVCDSSEQQYPFIPFEYEIILESLAIGDKLILADGGLEFIVKSVVDKKCVIIESTGFGIITSKKGLAIPNKSIPLPAITEKDRHDLKLGIELGIDAVALSFVQTADDIKELKKLLKEANTNIPVVAKLERQSAIDNLNSIVQESDMIMVARGDLGVECSLPFLPAMQKHIIQTCNACAKPVIVATQMLLSMVYNPTPTRAEVTDVANAVLDGADCVMLSEETAMGNYPVETVKYMHQITAKAEEFLLQTRALRPPDESSGTAQFLAYAACLLAEKNNVHCLAAHSLSGAAARQLSSCRPKQTIFVLTLDTVTLHALNFVWGVTPNLLDNESEPSHLYRMQNFINKNDSIPKGVQVVITAGDPSAGMPSSGTNLVKIFKK